jgi:hypothetical protein
MNPIMNLTQLQLVATIKEAMEAAELILSKEVPTTEGVRMVAAHLNRANNAAQQFLGMTLVTG